MRRHGSALKSLSGRLEGKDSLSSEMGALTAPKRIGFGSPASRRQSHRCIGPVPSAAPRKGHIFSSRSVRCPLYSFSQLLVSRQLIKGLERFRREWNYSRLWRAPRRRWPQTRRVGAYEGVLLVGDHHRCCEPFRLPREGRAPQDFKQHKSLILPCPSRTFASVYIRFADPGHKVEYFELMKKWLFISRIKES